MESAVAQPSKFSSENHIPNRLVPVLLVMSNEATFSAGQDDAASKVHFRIKGDVEGQCFTKAELDFFRRGFHIADEVHVRLAPHE